MDNGKKVSKTKGKTLTWKVVQSCTGFMPDGKCHLDLSFKDINMVPQSLQKLVSLHEVNLSRNLIKTIPDFIGGFMSIKVLDLHSNYLEEIPTTIGGLQDLEILNLSNNRLERVPKELGLLKNLHTLNLALNQLQTLPSSIGNLKLSFLNLSDNQFIVVPNCLGNLNKKVRISLDRNPFVTRRAFRQNSVKTTQTFHLVKGSDLCEECLMKCQTERGTVKNLEEMETLSDY